MSRCVWLTVADCQTGQAWFGRQLDLICMSGCEAAEQCEHWDATHTVLHQAVSCWYSTASSRIVLKQYCIKPYWVDTVLHQAVLGWYSTASSRIVLIQYSNQPYWIDTVLQMPYWIQWSCRDVTECKAGLVTAVVHGACTDSLEVSLCTTSISMRTQVNSSGI